MSDESRVDRRLWRTALLLALVYAGGGLAGHPIPTDTTQAAPTEPALQIWQSQTDADDEGGEVAAQAVAQLRHTGLDVVQHTVDGSASEAIVAFTGAGGSTQQPPPACSLLVVSSTTLSDLASERADLVTTTSAMQAAVAQGLLRRARPIAMLSSDPLSLAVPAHSQVRDVAALLAALRTDPDDRTFAMLDDTFSKASFAALVARARTLRLPGARAGDVPYAGYPTVQQALAALSTGAAQVILAPRAALLAAERAGLLRALAWPAGMSTPTLWVMLYAAPNTPPAALAALHRQLSALTAAKSWRASLAAGGRSPGRTTTTQLPGFERAAATQAVTLARLADQLQSLQP